MHSDKYRNVARRLWKRAHGPIPPKHHIHHRDGDQTNNALANLQCVSAFEHLSFHGKNKPRKPRRCTVCRAPFGAKDKRHRFCSNACRAKWRRDAGLDNEQRVCPCGKTFAINRYQDGLFCSRQCAGVGKYERPRYTVQCRHCGTLYEARDIRACWCSTRCRKRAVRLNVANRTASHA